MEHFAKTFFAYTNSLYNTENNELLKDFYNNLACVSKERRTRIERVRNNETKAELLMSALLRDYALYTVFDLKNPDISIGDNGKPFLKGSDNMFFNVSHSGKIVICTVSDIECGVDIEGTVSPHDLMAISNRFFSVEEQSAMLMSPNPNEVFCRLWTIRESYVKMRGCGFSIGLTALKCDFHRGKASIYENGVLQSDAVFQEIKNIPDFRACVCTIGDVSHGIIEADIF